jgi:hypothetical protein
MRPELGKGNCCRACRIVRAARIASDGYRNPAKLELCGGV